MVSPPELIDDAAAEIFVHLPPDEPAHLIRASLVCRQWRRIITDGAFLRRYRASHGVPPLLGFVCNLAARVDTITSPRFFPTAGPSIVPMPAFLGSSKALDCGHGRVLLGPFDDDTMARLVVLDPITGDHQIPRGYYTAAVFCAARGCAHLNCRGGPYRVVVAGAASSAGGAMRAHLYSSEAAAWVASARLIPCPHVRRKPAAVVGDDVYFQLMFADDMILRYDMGRNRLSTFHPPADAKEGGIVLLSMADGSLGLAGVRGSRLCLWSTDASPEGIAGWVRCKSIELMEKIPFMPYSEARVVGCAEGLGVVFVETEVGLFTIDLKSGRERKVSEPGNHFVVFPITSFYTPGMVAADIA
ncbi:hypothetical protein HU200_003353 [Digitaria exilis]|uniref:F-box domain-containing protein n=1 Tax=Digitaria exilis TaxID=1010633 RepID=A0A835FU65_9POAL|nr:hypothetical protein HU200_003353 [Digitaria exilis]